MLTKSCMTVLNEQSTSGVEIVKEAVYVKEKTLY